MAASNGLPEALVNRCSEAGIAIARRPEGLILDGVDLPIRSNHRRTINAAFAELLVFADRQGLPIAVTPARSKHGAGEKAQNSWFQERGFRANVGPSARDAFLQKLVREPARGLEDSVNLDAPIAVETARATEPSNRAELGATNALQQDPLERYRARFGDRGSIWIGRRAVELGPYVARQSRESGQWLHDRLQETDRALASAPRFQDLVAEWAQTDGRSAARVLAVEGELARRRQHAVDGKQPAALGGGRESEWVRVPYRYRELLTEEQVTRLEDRASELRRPLEARPDSFLHGQQEQLGTSDKVFGSLDRHPGEIAARDVAVRRELMAREAADAIAATQVAEVPAADIGARSEDISQLKDRCRTYLGDERAAAIFTHARALEERTRKMPQPAMESWAASLGDPLQGLDVKAALVVARAETAERTRRGQSRSESAMAEAAYTKARTHGDRRERQVRGEHEQAGETHRANAARFAASAANLKLGQQQIRDEGRHPDQWMQQHADRAARAIAARSVLEQQRQQAITAEPNHARTVEAPGPKLEQLERVAAADLGPGV